MSFLCFILCSGCYFSDSKVSMFNATIVASFVTVNLLFNPRMNAWLLRNRSCEGVTMATNVSFEVIELTADI